MREGWEEMSVIPLSCFVCLASFVGTKDVCVCVAFLGMHTIHIYLASILAIAIPTT